MQRYNEAGKTIKIMNITIRKARKEETSQIETIYNHENTIVSKIGCKVAGAMYEERGVWERLKTMLDEVIERDGKSLCDSLLFL